MNARNLAAALAAALCLAGPALAAPKLTALYADPAQPDLSGVWQVTGWFSLSPCCRSASAS